MKLEITLKSPDGYDQAIEDYIDLVDATPESRYEAREDAILRLSKWFESSEYVTLEYDTETDTMIVVRRS